MNMNNLIRDVLRTKTRQIETTTPTATVLEAVLAMNSQRIGSLLVANDAWPIGILTERDILVRVVEAGRDPATTHVEEVMTVDVVFVEETTTIGEAMAVMTRKRCRHLPVIDDGRLCGLVSAGDLAAWLVHEHERIIHEHERTILDLHDYITH